MAEGNEWMNRLTTTDGLEITFDPLLLEGDSEDQAGRNDSGDSVDGHDGHSEEDGVDPYDELGRTPPRQILARNRKWSADKKYNKEMGKRTYGALAGGKVINPKWVLRGGFVPRASYSPRARPKREPKKFAFARDLIEDQELFDYDSDSGTQRANNDRKIKSVGQDDFEEEMEEEPGRIRSNTISAASLRPASYGASQPSSIRQADSLPMGYRVETTNRFMSLASRPVSVPSLVHGDSLPTSGYATPRKRSSIGGHDRQAFFKTLKALYKNQRKQEKETARLELAETYERQQSKEDTMWQNELKEVIWLELQAWFAGKNVNMQDQWILNERQLVDQVAKMVLEYRFLPTDSTSDDSFSRQFSEESSTSTSLGPDIYYDAQESIEGRVSDAGLGVTLNRMGSAETQYTQNQHNSSLAELDHQDTLTQDIVNRMDVAALTKQDYSDDYCDSLQVFCQKRISSTHQALQQVANVMVRLENCENLFPSSRHLVDTNIAWGEEEFKMRVKVLCMWYNITIQLHQKVDQLGHILVGCGAHLKYIDWPKVNLEKGNPPDNEDLGKTHLLPEEKPQIPSKDVSTNKTPASPAKVVKFLVNDDNHSSTSPSDSNNSTDSGAASASNPALTRRQDSALSTGSLNSSVMSETSLIEGCSPYRKYVEKHLKTKGIRKTLYSLHRLTRGPLHRAKAALEKPSHTLDSDPLVNSGVELHPHLEERFSSLPTLSEDDKELAQCGCWSEQFQTMNLPSFRAVYLFLCRVPKDIIHECLKIRLEQKPLEPSELSIRQLMRECKEALKLAVSERQKYISRVKAAIYDLKKDKKFLESFEEEMEDFDEYLTRTLDIYLEYLRSFVSMIQVDSSLLISTYQKNLLEQEWEFIKTTCPHIPGGEARASNTFCQMACGILMSIGDFMRMGSDDIVKNMYDVSDDIDEEDNATRKTLYEALRGFQSLFGEARERTFKAISFAKLLRKDLEVAAEFHLAGGFDELMSRLQETEHVQVLAPHSAHHYIFVPKTISGHQEKILQMLDMHCGQANGVITENKGYLVLVDNSLCPEHLAVWEGDTIHVKPTAEAVIALAQIKVSGVLLVAPTASSLEARRKDFLRKMKEVISMSKEQRATSQAIANSLDQVKQEALQLRSQICEELVMVEERCDMSALDQAEKETLARRMREMLHQCYKFGFEYHKELDKLITGENSRQVQAQGVIQFSTQWMRFVLKWCERGKGLKPDWAAKGIEFLCFAADPKVTNFLSDDEFMDFKALTEDCHSHVVGDKETPERRQSVSPSPFERERAGPGRFSRSSSRQASPSRSTSRDETTLFNLKVSSPGTELDRIAMPPPQSPMGTMKRRKSGTRKSLTSVVDDECDVAIKVPAFATLPWSERVKRSIHNFENEREETRREQQVIGQVLDKTQPEDRIHIKARLVRFSWQRGVKIGQGTFGKVYTAINNETGDIMAMKEIPLQPNDHKTLRSVAEELRIFESIHHPNIINHFGVEIHREEMLIFMEYCPEGTLESLVSSTENGLEESIVRRYTRQLVEAVACLHEHGVVHRDIKGANIFLTEEMKTIKLGDFGCAVKIKAHTTMPGELQGFVGTQAYMAPEVFTRNMNEGHGRAADVWSMACVVLEMVQGERPWADLQSNYQIMFKVGMGQSPGVPDHLSEEGKDFLGTCFVQNPQERATAQDLLSHNFIKIFEEDENQSLPLFTSFSDFSEMRRSLVRKDSGKY